MPALKSIYIVMNENKMITCVTSHFAFNKPFDFIFFICNLTSFYLLTSTMQSKGLKTETPQTHHKFNKNTFNQ